MPLYELFCLMRPTLQKSGVADIIRRTALFVMDNSGVVTDIRYFGSVALAYKIRKSHGVYTDAQIFNIHFNTSTSLIPEIEHNLRVDDNVLRWAVLAKKTLPNLPKPWPLFNVPELQEHREKMRALRKK